MSNQGRFWRIFLVEFAYWVSRIGIFLVPIVSIFAFLNSDFYFAEIGSGHYLIVGMVALGVCFLLALLTARLQLRR